VWAQENLNVYQLLNTFEIVPGPIKERQTIQDILRTSQKKNGDTYFAISYRWWESWQLYVNYGHMSLQQQEFLDSLKKSRAKQPNDMQHMLPFQEEEEKSDLDEYVKQHGFVDYKA
jgi:hypothetical protein